MIIGYLIWELEILWKKINFNLFQLKKSCTLKYWAFTKKVPHTKHSCFPSLAPSYAEMVGTASSSTNVFRTPLPAERLEKLEIISIKDERWWNLVKVKVTHHALSNSSPNPEEHVE